MPTPYVGRGLSLGFGEESTWGTAVARTHWYRGITESMARKVSRKPRPTLAEATGSRNRKFHYTESDTAGGSVELLMTYEGCGLLLKHVLGGTPTTTGPVSGIYTHTYTLAGNLPTGLTHEVIRGNGTAEVFEGCKVSKATLKIVAGGLMTLALDLVAETSGGRVAAGTATFTTNDLPVVHNQAGVFTWNAQTYTLKSFELTIDNKLATRMLLGSNLTAEPVPSDFLDVNCKVEVEWNNDNLVTALTADTQADASIAFTGTGSRTLTVNLHNLYLEEVSDPVSGVGVVAQSATFRAESDGTDEGVSVVLTNTQSSATAA